MVNLNLIQNGQVNHLVLKTILEMEEPEFGGLNPLVNDYPYKEIPLREEHLVPLGKDKNHTGTLYHISLGGSLWAEIYQEGNDYHLVGLS